MLSEFKRNKGYLSKIISEKAVSELQFKNFLFNEKVTILSQDIRSFVFLNIPSTPKRHD